MKLIPSLPSGLQETAPLSRKDLRDGSRGTGHDLKNNNNKRVIIIKKIFKKKK